MRASYATAQPLWQDLDLRLRFDIGYELWAHYTHASPGLFSDDSCAQGFRVA